jgi:Flp pilus assembly pilin Flp
MLKYIGNKARALHSDQQGADMVEYVLIIAAVALPLLAVIIWFWRDISAWAGDAYTAIKGTGTPAGETNPDSLGH